MRLQWQDARESWLVVAVVGVSSDILDEWEE
jgi:hypothetical protein